MTTRREDKRERRRVEKESGYLAILVVAHLDRLANKCMHVSLDDGTCEGRPAAQDGETYEPTIETPTFDPLGLGLDWKVLPARLMYGILNLPYRIEQLDNHIAGSWEFDDPPKFTEFFWARRYGYAELGLAISDLAKQLRKHAGLPIEEPAEGEWNRDACMQEQMDKITEARKARDDRYNAKHPA
ncbi:hypothetical protein GTP44_20480 [Duganella sp. FT50W]|uniref:Uncharacterized protein n=2 Tax=Duganella lactea TaxID=2692173 RepID=A0A6L8MM57_9BURK|nr:hypothetical protein [Duganella lactea]